MSKFIRKTILILSVVFAVFYVYFNFGFVVFESMSFLGLIGNSVIDSDGLVDINASAYLFPISLDKKSAVKKIAAVFEPNINYPYSLSIPSIGVNVPMILESTINRDKIFSQLEKGVVHYAETPLPGQKGTAVIIGHSSVYPWYQGKYGHIFASLSKLQNGDIIQVDNNGEIFNYKVSRSIIFSPKSVDDFELRSLEYTDGSSIVLMTCWPTGTNAKRVAVRADLVI